MSSRLKAEQQHSSSETEKKSSSITFQGMAYSTPKVHSSHNFQGVQSKPMALFSKQIDELLDDVHNLKQQNDEIIYQLKNQPLLKNEILEQSSSTLESVSAEKETIEQTSSENLSNVETQHDESSTVESVSEEKETVEPTSSENLSSNIETQHDEPSTVESVSEEKETTEPTSSENLSNVEIQHDESSTVESVSEEKETAEPASSENLSNVETQHDESSTVESVSEEKETTEQASSENLSSNIETQNDEPSTVESVSEEKETTEQTSSENLSSNIETQNDEPSTAETVLSENHIAEQSQSLAKNKKTKPLKQKKNHKNRPFQGVERTLPTAQSKTMMALLAKQIDALPEDVQKVEEVQKVESDNDADSPMPEPVVQENVATSSINKPKKKKKKKNKAVAKSEQQANRIAHPVDDEKRPDLRIIIRIERIDDAEELALDSEIITTQQHHQQIDGDEHQHVMLNGDATSNENDGTQVSPLSEQQEQAIAVVIDPIDEEQQRQEMLIQRDRRLLTWAYVGFFCGLLTGVMALPTYFLMCKMSKLADMEVWAKTHCTWILQHHAIFLSIVFFAVLWFIPLFFVAWDSAMWVKSMTVIGVVFLCVAWLFLLNAFVKGIGQYIFKKSVV